MTPSGSRIFHPHRKRWGIQILFFHKDYRTDFLDLFNSATFQNALKWTPVSGEWGKLYKAEQTIEALKWAKTN